MRRPAREFAAALAVLALAASGGTARAAPPTQPAPAAARPSPDDQALIDKAIAYLSGLGEAKGRFIQTDSRGTAASGAIYLARPGRARLVYDPPWDRVVVSDGRTVFVSDPRLKTFNHYPLSATPLSLFLAKDVRLDRGVQVTRVQRLADGFILTARDARHPRSGELTLTFSGAPIRLTEWRLTAAQGQTTTVRIPSLEPTSGLDPGLFVARDPRTAGARP